VFYVKNLDNGKINILLKSSKFDATNIDVDGNLFSDHKTKR